MAKIFTNSNVIIIAISIYQTPDFKSKCIQHCNENATKYYRPLKSFLNIVFFSDIGWLYYCYWGYVCKCDKKVKQTVLVS